MLSVFNIKKTSQCHKQLLTQITFCSIIIIVILIPNINPLSKYCSFNDITLFNKNNIQQKLSVGQSALLFSVLNGKKEPR
jgi:hypothetical protein